MAVSTGVAKGFPSPSGGPPESTARQSTFYDPAFWKSYLANTLVMVAIAVLFRYADFVTYLGGSELHLGWIVGVGMVGSLMMRVFLGTAIDRYGARLVWLSGLALFAVSCFGHLLVTHYNGPAIYLLRIGFCCAIAAVLGASMTFISGRVPVARMAEVLGMLGTSGFLGLVLGSQLGDLLIDGEIDGRWQVGRLFLASGLLGVLALGAAWWATREYRPPARRRRPPLAWVLRRYFPGTVLLVGVAMGFGYGLPQTFLRTYAADVGIPRIGLFFAVYAATAITTRVLTRRLPERLGLQPMILLGLVFLVLGQMLFLVVDAEWQLAIPGISFGISHAILFPSAVAEGCGTFPARYRGLATTLMLATYDVGQLIGAPTAGVIVHVAGRLGLPSYPVMFATVAVLLGAVGTAYGVTRRKRAALLRGTNGQARRAAPTFPQAGGSRRWSVASPRENRPAARSPSECGPG